MSLRPSLTQTIPHFQSCRCHELAVRNWNAYYWGLQQRSPLLVAHRKTSLQYAPLTFVPGLAKFRFVASSLEIPANTIANWVSVACVCDRRSSATCFFFCYCWNVQMVIFVDSSRSPTRWSSFCHMGTSSAAFWTLQANGPISLSQFLCTFQTGHCG